MKTIKYLKITTIVVIALGIIHIAATPVIFPIFKPNAQLDLASVFMYVMTGVSTLFLGWLQNYTLKKINDNEGFKKIFIVSVLFLAFMGLSAVAAMWDNPFAYISLIVASCQFILYRKLKIDKNE